MAKGKAFFQEEIRINTAAINTGMNYPKVNFMIDLFDGMPRKHLTSDCQPPTNPKIVKHLAYGFDVGPFNVSGLKPACESLKRIFTAIRNSSNEDVQELYQYISTAGMLCCRAIRGTKNTPSNHSFGAAIDFKIGGRLDDRGDGHAFRGLFLMYPYFQNEGWWWGAEYRDEFEDAMHFDVSKEKLLQWRKAGIC